MIASTKRPTHGWLRLCAALLLLLLPAHVALAGDLVIIEDEPVALAGPDALPGELFVIEDDPVPLASDLNVLGRVNATRDAGAAPDSELDVSFSLPDLEGQWMYIVHVGADDGATVRVAQVKDGVAAIKTKQEGTFLLIDSGSTDIYEWGQLNDIAFGYLDRLLSSVEDVTGELLGTLETLYRMASEEPGYINIINADSGLAIRLPEDDRFDDSTYLGVSLVRDTSVKAGEENMIGVYGTLMNAAGDVMPMDEPAEVSFAVSDATVASVTLYQQTGEGERVEQAVSRGEDGRFSTVVENLSSFVVGW